MEKLTDAFVKYLFQKREMIGQAQLSRAEACLKDYLAVAVAGARKNQDKWQAMLADCPAGKVELLGYDRKTDGKTAALINGFNAHSLELDDGQRFAMIHLGACIISAVRAAAQEHAVEGEQILQGVILGYEAACRLSIAMQPSHKQRGYHASGTCGTIGAAVGAAIALGMDQSRMKRVVTAAAGSAAGMLEMQEQKSELKPYNVGRAAMDGLAAAYMGDVPLDTPDDILGGERGFFATFSDEYSPEKLLEQQSYFELERIYVKPYASCRHSHSAVEAAIRLNRVIDPAKVSQVCVDTYKLGVKGHEHSVIQGIASAKLSTPYAVAAGLLLGKADLSAFEPVNEEVAALAQKIVVREDPQLTAESPKQRIAVVTVTMQDGTQETCRVNYAKGDPENPLTEAELEEKYSSLMNYQAK